MIARVFLFITVLFLSAASGSQELQMYHGFLTWHNDDKDYNERNRFVAGRLGLRTDRQFFSVDASSFINSHYSDAYTLGLGWDLLLADVGEFDLWVGAGVGVLNGYTEDQFDAPWITEDDLVYVSGNARVMWRDTFGISHRRLGPARTLEFVISVPMAGSN